MTTSEQARADHECSACGGTGKKPAWCGIEPAVPQCRVCLGSGRISDRMPAADAMADAETLRPLSVDSDHTQLHVADAKLAQEYGNDAAAWMAHESADLAATYATVAARAALRAVPGLRS